MDNLVLLRSAVDWDQFFINMCVAFASKSKDPSTKVGAVIIDQDNIFRSGSWNGFPRGVNDYTHRYYDKEVKYSMVVHAEANSICNAARVGIPLDGCSMYVYPLLPCNECTKLIIQVGIKEVIAINFDKSLEIWKEKFKTSKTMLDEAGVLFRTVEDKNIEGKESS